MANMEKMTEAYGKILWTGKKCILGMPISLTRYILTETTLYTKVGLINIKEDELELYRVMDKKLKLPLGQRIFGCGTILITAKDSDTPEKQVTAIKNARVVKRILDDAIRDQRDKYLVRGRDMIGANADFSDDDNDLDMD